MSTEPTYDEQLLDKFRERVSPAYRDAKARERQRQHAASGSIAALTAALTGLPLAEKPTPVASKKAAKTEEEWVETLAKATPEYLATLASAIERVQYPAMVEDGDYHSFEYESPDENELHFDKDGQPLLDDDEYVVY
jgi:hypothetical protein